MPTKKGRQRRSGQPRFTPQQELQRRWAEAEAELAHHSVRPCTRTFVATLRRLALEGQHHEVFRGYGGYRDAQDRERAEAARAAGRPRKEGFAELSGMSRSSMIRARHQAVQLGLLNVVPGGGTRANGSAIGGRGLANAYRLPPAPPPRTPPPPKPKPDPEQAERNRQLLRQAVANMGAPKESRRALPGLDPRGP